METIIRTDPKYYIENNKVIYLKESKYGKAYISFKDFNNLITK